MKRLIFALITIVAVCAVTICFCACVELSRQYQRPVYGTYEATYRARTGKVLGKETLYLLPNGSFNQVFRTKDSVMTNRGRWVIEGSPGERLISLSGVKLYCGLDDMTLDKNPARTNEYLPVIRTPLEIRVLINDDLGLWYRKLR